MNAPFFITGLPRTRTSWLANLFSDGRSFCHHDLFGLVGSVAEFKRKLQPANGDSDSAAMLYYDALKKLFPEARWLLVLREPQEAIDSLLATARGTSWAAHAARFSETQSDWLPRYEARVNQMLQDPNVLILTFEALEFYGAVDHASRFLRGVGLDAQRFDMLNKMLIEPIPAKTPMQVNPQLLEEFKQWQS